MEISIKKALNTPFNDKEWYKKIIIGVLLYIPALFAAISFGEKSWITSSLGYIASFILGGYAWIVWHNEINNIENVLPDWNFIKVLHLAVQGFLIYLGYSLISLPIIAVFIALLIYLKSLVIILAILGVIIAFCWYLVFVPIAQSLFAKDFEFIEAFNFQKVFDIAKNSWKYYLLAVLYSILIGLIFGISSGFIGGILGFFNKFIGGFIVQIGQVFIIIASANLYGQTFKKAIQPEISN